MRNKIERSLLDIWSSAGMRGYWCAVEATEWVCHCVTPWNITKDVYLAVAERLNMNVRCVEKNLRYYIDCVWKYGNVEKLGPLFGERSMKPGNKEFISVLARRLQLGEKEA